VCQRNVIPLGQLAGVATVLAIPPRAFQPSLALATTREVQRAGCWLHDRLHGSGGARAGPRRRRQRNGWLRAVDLCMVTGMKETPLDRRMPRAFAVIAGIGAAVFCGFTASCKQAPAVLSASPSAIVTPAVPPAVSVNDLMVGLVGYAANELWSVEQEGRAPKTDEDWQKIKHHAIQLAASGTLTALGGTSQADRAWAMRPDWNKYAQQMTDVGLAALEAARRKDLDAVITVNEQIGDVCERCHRAIMP